MTDVGLIYHNAQKCKELSRAIQNALSLSYKKEFPFVFTNKTNLAQSISSWGYIYNYCLDGSISGSQEQEQAMKKAYDNTFHFYKILCEGANDPKSATSSFRAALKKMLNILANTIENYKRWLTEKIENL